MQVWQQTELRKFFADGQQHCGCKKKSEDEKVGRSAGEELRFEDVSFKYPGAEGDVLEHISFTAKSRTDDRCNRKHRLRQINADSADPEIYDVTEGKNYAGRCGHPKFEASIN